MASTRPTKKARKSAPETSSDNVIDIDLKGDLVLKVGSKHAKLIRVSSKHMTTISKVFEALLSPHFREGQTQHDSLNPLELPDDDPEAIESLCKLAHHKTADQSNSKARYLPELFVTCDKYDCVEAFRTYFSLALRQWLTETEKHFCATTRIYNYLSLLEALCIAYLADDEWAFKTISSHVLKHSTKEHFDKAPKQLLRILPEGFRDAVRGAFGDAMENICAKAQRPIEQFRNRIPVALISAVLFKEVCQDGVSRLAFYMLGLTKYGMLPATRDNDVFRHIRSYLYHAKRLSKLPKCKNESDCRCCSYDFDTAALKAAEDAESEIGHLCLRRVKEGKYKRYRHYADARAHKH